LIQIKNKSDVAFYLLTLMALFPLMPFGILSISTICFAIISIIFFRDNLFSNFKERKKVFFINISFFLVLCLTIVISEDKNQAVKYIIRDLNLLVFPLIVILLFPKIKKSQLQKILNVYIFATTVVLIMFIYQIIQYAIINFHLKDFLDFPFRNIIEGKTYLDISPTYLSIWFSFSIFCIVNKTKRSANKKNKVLLLILAFLFYAFVFISSARIVFLSLNIILILLFFTLQISLKKKAIFSLTFFVALAVVFLTFKQGNTFKYRYFEELFKKELKLPRGRTPSSLSIRYGIYNCAKQIILESPIVGYGLGDVQEKYTFIFLSYVIF